MTLCLTRRCQGTPSLMPTAHQNTQTAYPQPTQTTAHRCATCQSPRLMPIAHQITQTGYPKPTPNNCAPLRHMSKPCPTPIADQIARAGVEASRHWTSQGEMGYQGKALPCGTKVRSLGGFWDIKFARIGGQWVSGVGFHMWHNGVQLLGGIKYTGAARCLALSMMTRHIEACLKPENNDP